MKKLLEYSKLIVLSALVIAAGTNESLAQNYESIKEKGPHPVGFKVVNATDFSRSYKGNIGRPIQIAIWYPSSNENRANKLSYSRYLELQTEEEGDTNHTRTEKENNLASWRDVFANRSQDSTLNWNNFFSTRLNIYKQTLVAEGLHPLVVYGAGSQGEAFENSVLFEYLASYGYIVAAVPSLGTFRHEMNIDSRGLETQSSDLEFAIGKIKEDETFKIDKIVTMGWSWGGLAAMLAQVRNSHINAVVSIDGSVATHIDKIRAFPYFKDSNLSVPYFILSTFESSYKRTKEFFDGLKYSQSYLAGFHHIDHSDFTSYNYIARKRSNSAPLMTEAYEAACRYILAFLDKEILNKESAISFLQQTPVENSFSENLIQLESQAAYPLPPSEGEFFDIIKQEGASKGWDIYTDVKNRDSEYEIFEAYNLTVLAFQFARDSARTDESVQIMEMVLDEYPNSYSSYALRGRIHEIRGETALAYEHFSKAYGMALMDGQDPGHNEEKVFYQDIKWYNEKINSLKETLED